MQIKAQKLPFWIQPNRTWIVNITLTMLLFWGLLQTKSLAAQEPASVLEFLEAELWPDFDQQALLVLLSGALPANAPLPATITLPLPQEATINAVARVDSQGNLVNMEYDDSIPGLLTLNVNDPGFRIEYYVPYQSDGDLRKINFRWLADLSVDQLITTFQQPSSATDVSLTPEADRTLNGQYDLLYHEISGMAVPAGVPYTFEASYRMVRPELSVEGLDLQQPAVPQPVLSQQGQDGSDSSNFNWPIVVAAAAVVLAFAAAAFLIFSGRNRSRRVTKPRPAARSQQRLRSTGGRDSTSSPRAKAKYCHECGQALDPADKFCPSCGSRVKGGGN